MTKTPPPRRALAADTPQNGLDLSARASTRAAAETPAQGYRTRRPPHPGRDGHPAALAAPLPPPLLAVVLPAPLVLMDARCGEFLRQYAEARAREGCHRLPPARAFSSQYAEARARARAAIRGHARRADGTRRISTKTRTKANGYGLRLPATRRPRVHLCARPRRGVACQAAGCDMAARC